MTKFDTVVRAFCTVALTLWCVALGRAESVLSFVQAGPGEISVTNSALSPADVRFTLYTPEGQPATGSLVNNASFRVPARGQFSMSTSEIFRLKGDFPLGWIQVTSQVNGLGGVQLNGDPRSKFEGVSAGVARTSQIVPYLSQQPAVHSTLLVTNPNSQPADVSVFFFDAFGRVVREELFELPARAQEILETSGAVARVLASGDGVIAAVVLDSGSSMVLIQGQNPGANSSRSYVIPYFKNGNGVSSALVIANPSGSEARVDVSFMTPSGGRQYFISQVPVAGNGSVVLGWQALTGLLGPPAEGWLLVASEVPLAGVSLMDSGASATAIPLQTIPLDRQLITRPTSTGNARLIFVGDVEQDAVVSLTLNRPDGTAAAEGNLTVARLSQIAVSLNELLPAGSPVGGFITVRSSVALHSIEIIDSLDGKAEGILDAQQLAADFAVAPITAAPRISPSVEGALEPGAGLNVFLAAGIGSDPVLFVNGKVVPATLGVTGSILLAALPSNLEPGPVTLMVHSSNGDTDIVTLGVYSPDGSLTKTIKGQAVFQKVEVTDSGLDLTRTSAVPIRNALVEVVDRITQTVVSTSQTDGLGRFSAWVPEGRPLTVRVVSRLRFQDLRVLNNTDGNKLYVVSRDIETPQDVELFETSRNAGAFNILDAIQLGNALVSAADPRLLPPPVTVYWSERNTNRVGKVSDGLIGTTFFNLSNNTGYVLGDRNTDSDEFDDAVIIHEYAHMLAARFSRDDSPGGAHLLGDVLDPRVAWSEGFANFFSSAARGTSIYRDSKGPTGAIGVRYDLEANVPNGDRPGYSSEASVQGLLWDLFDANADDGDSVRFPISSIWAAITDLKNDRFVYLPYFLEHFLDRNPSFVEDVRKMVILRSIDFQPGVRPSVTNPFPRVLAFGESRVGEVDSQTTKRTNLANSAHFFSFSMSAAGPMSLRLDIEGLGPANSPSANDLDLFLYDANGRRISQSDTGLNAQSERIQLVLGAGTYYAEVRSYYTRAETNTSVFNSGRYRLTLSQ